MTILLAFRQFLTFVTGITNFLEHIKFLEPYVYDAIQALMTLIKFLYSFHKLQQMANEAAKNSKQRKR